MRIKMPNGVILECYDNEINQSRLKNGGIEVVEKVKEYKAETKKTTKNKKK